MIEKLAKEIGFKGDLECLEEGFNDERKEHPEFTDKQVAMIARDHLKMDEGYYDDEYKSKKGRLEDIKNTIKGKKED